MPYTKKTSQKSEPEPKTIPCPLHRGAHEIEIVMHPEDPYLVIARCGGRIVLQTSKRNVATKTALKKLALPVRS